MTCPVWYIYTVFHEESESEDQIDQFFKRGEELYIRSASIWVKIQIWDPRPLQLTVYTVFDEEPEFEVEKCQILEPGGKI